MTRGNCFICEADLYVKDATIFQKDLQNSCYYGRMQEGYSEDWVFELRDEQIVRIGKGGSDTYNMVGVAYFKQEEATMLKEMIENAYSIEANSQLFWDDVVNNNLDKLKLTVEPVEQGQLVEIDTVEELKAIHEGI